MFLQSSGWERTILPGASNIATLSFMKIYYKSFNNNLRVASSLYTVNIIGMEPIDSSQQLARHIINCLVILILQTMTFYTRGKALVVCLLMPMFWVAVYSIHADILEAVILEKDNTQCIPRADSVAAFSLNITLNTLLYATVPPLLVLVLNTAIIVRLRKYSLVRSKLTAAKRSESKLGFPTLQAAVDTVSTSQSTIASTAVSQCASTTTGTMDLSSVGMEMQNTDSYTSNASFNISIVKQQQNNKVGSVRRNSSSMQSIVYVSTNLSVYVYVSTNLSVYAMK